MQVTFTFFFLHLGDDGFSTVAAADARELAGQGTAAVAERMSVLDTPMVNTAAVAGYSSVDNAMTAS